MFSPRAVPGAVLAAIAVQVALTRAAKQCYWMDGTISDSVMQPCNPDAAVSACCGLNKERPDICLSSGLCYAQDPGFEGFIYANGCTDQTGQDEKCPHFCTDRLQKWQVYNVLQCEAGDPSNQFCCRTAFDKTNCCGNKTAIMRTSVGTIVFPTSTAWTGGASSSSMAPTASSASATCGPAHMDNATTKDCPKDNTAVVGGAVGGVLGAALLVALGAIAALCMRRPKDHLMQNGQYYTPAPNKEGPPGYPHTASSLSHEVETFQTGIESVPVPAQELPVQSVHEVQGDNARERNS